MKRLARSLKKCFHRTGELTAQVLFKKKKKKNNNFTFRVGEYIKIYQINVVKEIVAHMPTNCPG